MKTLAVAGWVVLATLYGCTGEIDDSMVNGKTTNIGEQQTCDQLCPAGHPLAGQYKCCAIYLPNVGKDYDPALDKPDLDVLFLSWSNEYEYDATPNKPQAGDNVVWRATIENRGTRRTGAFAYMFVYDNAEVSGCSGSAGPDLEPGSRAHVSCPRAWQDGAHTMACKVDPNNKIDEISELNNQVADRTDALKVGIWVERSERDYYNQRQFSVQKKYLINDGANSFEDFLQRQMRQWNIMMANASPNIGMDRFRISKVVLVEDGALPLDGGPRDVADVQPDTSDKTVDLMFGFPWGTSQSMENLLDKTNVANPFARANESEGYKANMIDSVQDCGELDPFCYPFAYDAYFMHETMHARYLVDSYCLNVFTSEIDVRDDSGNLLFPAVPGSADPIHFNSTYPSIMNAGAWKFSEWEINWLNQYHHERPLQFPSDPGKSWKNYNGHEGTRYYMSLRPAAPQTIALRVLDAKGEALADAQVLVYQSSLTGATGNYCPKKIDNAYDLNLTTNSAGMAYLANQGNNWFSVNSSDVDGTNFHLCVNFLKIKANNQEAHVFMDLPQIHNLYFNGQTSLAWLAIQTTIQPACTPNCGTRNCGPEPNGCGFCPPGSSNGLCSGDYNECIDGTCQCQYAACDTTCCPSGQVCYEHACCNRELYCSGKQCGDDGCGGECGTCGSNQTCSGGECVCTPCNGGPCCPAGEHCNGFQCVCDGTNEVKCNGVCCGSNEHCDSNNHCDCDSNDQPKCSGNCCPSGQTCEGGSCSFCTSTTCPRGNCENGTCRWCGYFTNSGSCVGNCAWYSNGIGFCLPRGTDGNKVNECIHNGIGACSGDFHPNTGTACEWRGSGCGEICLPIGIGLTNWDLCGG